MTKPLSFKITSNHMLLCVFLCLLWDVTESNTTLTTVEVATTSPPNAITVETETTTEMTTLTTIKPPPLDVDNVTVVKQNENNITLQWEKVNNIETYTLKYGKDGDFEERNINASTGDQSVTYDVTNLTAGTMYSFTLFTISGELRSLGYNFTSFTLPRNAEDFMSSRQTETSITLRWTKVENTNYTLEFNNETMDFNVATEEDGVERTILNLTGMTQYDFTLYTVFQHTRSSGAKTTGYTAPPPVQHLRSVAQNESSITLQWQKVGEILEYIVSYNRTNRTVNASMELEQVTQTISGLKSGSKHNFSVLAVFQNIRSIEVTISLPTAPRNAEVVTLGQTETSISLEWPKVDVILTYKFSVNGKEENVTASEEQEIVNVTIPGLRSGTKYQINVFTLFENIPSSGTNFSAATVPSPVTSVRVSERSLTNITLEWEDVGRGWSYIAQMNEETKTGQLQPKKSTNLRSCTFDGLKPGEVYQFNVTSEFSELKSTAYENVTATVIDCGAVPWYVTSSSIQGAVEGKFTTATATNGSRDLFSPEGRNVSFTGLYPGATYNVSLVYEINNQPIPMCKNKLHPLHLPPSDLKARCKNWAGGYSINIDWEEPVGLWTAVEVNVTGKNHTVSNPSGHVIIPGFQPAQHYEVSVALLSRNERSQHPYVFTCFTDARGVIAGSFFAVLLFAILVCVAVFIWFKRPDIIHRNKPFIGGSKLSEKTCKPISVKNFPDHFNKLCMDENRGFSEEYENILTVGKEQTQKDAILPPNTAKNRYSNVLPYDWCRVKLNKSSPEETSDYINASYMPGYSRGREYIATQGPLPTTVKDFWRMVWEQRVQGIVMVTNCTESGRIKCEQYWPADSQPCSYGELEVTVISVEQEPNWILRDFRIKHESTSEERTVKHFHFTAWPDHGVPQGTEVLIQFRGLIRQHIEQDGAGAPTVVHCSAGVGRTGTIIALDVLLQQIQTERAVGINGFVRKMRLSRPHMVQTESQYVFLHQCVSDSLKPKEKNEENIYENADIIYANATALREFNSNV